MADEILYASVGGESNKRKYEDSPPRATRRATGFSSPPDSGAPPSAYNSVPPPMSEIEVAKQKAQEIAARILNAADPTKRARVENGGGGGGGFDSSSYGSPKPTSLGLGFGATPQVASSGYPGPSKKIEVPNGRVGVIIGKGGETIKYLQLQSGAKIQVTRDMDADPNSTTRGVDLMGTPDQIAKAEQLINDVLSEAEAGGSGIISRRVTGQPSGAEQFVMMVPNNKVGLVIGKGGETIKNMQARTGARIQVIPLHLPPGDTSKERTVQIDGTSEQIEAAKQLVEEVTSENRPRNQTMSGGYSQQGGYQARPPTNWAPPGPPQQSGYGYSQPGAYPTPSPQYNMNQPPYSGYPPQAPTSGGYPTTWDPSTAPQQNPQAPQTGAYDYYNQQQQTAPTDASSGYGYSQAQAYTQGYGQDGYGGYQSGYNQPQSNPAAGYDNQQQGYSSAAYGSGASNPAPDSQHPAASYGAQSEAVPNPNYPPQASTQAGYGAPPPQKPPAYAQPQQSPSAQSGAGGYAQPGYPHSQSGYAQVDSGSQRPPSSGYQVAQQGYGAPPYGGPPPSQSSYGQQQQQPPSYGGSYGSGYSQPQAYAADGSAGGGAHGSYDATPPPQSAQPGGPAKASPPS